MLGGAQSESPLITPQQQQEQEALKRNTDCVYFLASPLTCKKGIECEYRHSDIARLNPRDCWYWLNGNCLNPKCAFRHPPLIIEVTTPAVNSLPPSQIVVPVASQGPNVPGKQVVPCIFFQQGYCLKGDMCPFMHSPYSLNNKVIQSAGATPISESQTNKKTFGGLGKHTQEQKVSRANAPKSADLPPHMKSTAVVGKAPLRNEISISRNEPFAVGLDGELPRYSRGNVHLSSNGNLVSRSKRNSQVHALHTLQDQSILNVKDADEISREPSPGFDVLVDDEIRDSEYYHDADQYGRTGHDGMNFTAANEYDIGLSADYGSVGGVDLDMYCDSRNYDSFDHLQGKYDSSERMLRGSAHLERRQYPRADSPGRIDGSDLRHHLSKQKRNNGLRSVISRDSSRENHADGRNSQASRREQLPVHEASSRLRGRIKIPGRSMSPIDRINPHIEREIDRSSHLRRLFPERPLGRLRDRIKGRVQEDFDNERNFRDSSTRRDIIYDNSAEFSGPKSLSELKVCKTSESFEQHMNDRLLHGKRKYPQMEEVKQGEGDVSFEGPKPLSEILKRKRGGNVAIHESGSTNDRENSEKEGKESMKIPTEAKELKYSFSSEANNKVNQGLINEGSEAGEVGVADENNKSYDGQSSLQRNASELHIEEGMIGDEAYDQRRGDFDYDEQADGEDYINIDEGENADAEDDHFDEDDDADDFAKKMGAMYS